VACKSTLFGESGPKNIAVSTAVLTQFIVTYTDDAGATPKFTHDQGNALGARLDETGAYIGRSQCTSAPIVSAVPERGALALALTALFGAALATRRRRAG